MESEKELVTLNWIKERREVLNAMSEKEAYKQFGKNKYEQSRLLDRLEGMLFGGFEVCELKLIWFLRHTRAGSTYKFMAAAENDYKAYRSFEELKVP